MPTRRKQKRNAPETAQMLLVGARVQDPPSLWDGAEPVTEGLRYVGPPDRTLPAVPADASDSASRDPLTLNALPSRPHRGRGDSGGPDLRRGGAGLTTRRAGPHVSPVRAASAEPCVRRPGRA